MDHVLCDWMKRCRVATWCQSDSLQEEVWWKCAADTQLCVECSHFSVVAVWLLRMWCIDLGRWSSCLSLPAPISYTCHFQPQYCTRVTQTAQPMSDTSLTPAVMRNLDFYEPLSSRGEGGHCLIVQFCFLAALDYILGTRYSVLGTRYSVLGTRYSVLGTRYSVLGTRYSVLGTRYSVLGTRYSVLGTH